MRSLSVHHTTMPQSLSVLDAKRRDAQGGRPCAQKVDTPASLPASARLAGGVTAFLS
jgi:hypothetical protein